MSDPRGQPIIGLTLRHDRTDSFWFTLLHECAHVSLHFSTLMKGEAVFIDDMEIRSEDEYEREADALAQESLIPSNILDQVNWGPNTTFEDLMTLATRARVHPSIAAGRWQRDHQNYKRFSRITERNAIRRLFQAA
jgi:HTH-type transcriptional regulator/antitoxin HigA